MSACLVEGGVTQERLKNRWSSIASSVRRINLAHVLFTGMSAIAFVFILWQGRTLTFLRDDWVLIGQTQWLSVDSWMAPGNQHWAVFFYAVFRPLYAVVGMHSYLPYLAVLLAIHVIAAGGLYRLLYRVSGPLLALAAAALILFLGTAHEDLYWAVQISYLGSVAAGIWALVALYEGLGKRSTWICVALLIVAEGTSGIGLFFVAAAAGLVLSDGSLRRRWAAIGVPVAVYAAWYLIWGRSGGAPITPDAISGLPAFAVEGMGNAIRSMVGVVRPIGEVAASVLVVGVAWRVLRDEPVPPLAVAGVTGLVAQWVIIGVARDAGGPDLALAPRYIYPAAFLILVALAALLGKAATLRQQGVRALVLAPLVVVGMFTNVSALVDAVPQYQSDADMTRATLMDLDLYGNTPAVMNSSHTILPIDILKEQIREHGSPVRDDIRPSVVTPISPATADRALVALTMDSFTLTASSSSQWSLSQPELLGTYNASTSPVGSCLEANPLYPDSQLWVKAPSGSAFLVTADYGGDLGVYLSHDADAQEANAIHLGVVGGNSYAVRVPDLGPGFVWQLRFKLPAGSRDVSVCAASSH